jgi:predicted membrane channel-forming protein YqfA (hemolysin III family)
MNQYIIDMMYKGVGITLMGIVCIIGIIGIVGSIQMLRQINKLKDNE